MSLRCASIRRSFFAITALCAAVCCVACKNSLDIVGSIANTDSIPTMVIDSMRATQSDRGRISGTLMAPLMERYTTSKGNYEVFPRAFRLLAYTATGEIETEITADKAVHATDPVEKWEAFGHVVIVNHIKHERMETDTLYWDRQKKRIYTHCFVKMSSPDFYMQGYGMESDERAANAIILEPFDSYGDFEREKAFAAPASEKDSLQKHGDFEE